MKRNSDNSAIIRTAFEKYSPSEELTERVKEKRFVRRKRRISLKRAVIIPAAACIALLFTVTAAAELFGFDEILGKYIRIDDSELAQSLIGTVSDVKYTISDDDYKIEVMGVTGSHDSMFAAVKLSRKDGTPVTEHFVTDSTEYTDNISWLRHEWNIHAYLGGFGGTYGSYIDEYGDIIYTMDISGDNISGKKIGITCGRLVLHRESFELKNENNVYYGMNHKKWGYFERGTNEPVDLDDSSVLCLPIEWSVSFRYTASDNALAVRYADTSSQDKDDYTVTEVKVSSSGVRISVTGGESVEETTFGYSKEAYMIMQDGSAIPLYCSGGSGQPDGEYWQQSMDFDYYEDGYDIKKYIDISQAKAVYFDGVTYELQ